MQSYEEKLELEVSIPRKLYDEWEPTIKIAYDQNKAFTKHIVDALMQSHKEKLELEVSIPRKLYDEWEPTLKIKIKDYECHTFCDFGSSVCTIPKTLCDVLGFREFDDCSLNFHLADSTIMKPMGRIMVFLLLQIGIMSP